MYSLKNTLFTLITVFLFLSLNEVTGQKKSKKVKLKASGTKEVNSPLPNDYTDRTFIRGLAGYRDNIDQLVGHILLIRSSSIDNSKKGKKDVYTPPQKPKVLGRYVVKNNPPKIEAVITDNVLYSSKIDGKYQFNGHYMIAAVSANVESIYELTISDIASVILPDSLIPYTEICEAYKNAVSNGDSVDLYYVKSAKLSTVYSKEYVKVEGKTEVAGGDVFGLQGEIYNSVNNYSINYVVSADIVNLRDMLALKNCDKKLQEKQALIAAAEKAKEDAKKAKELQKAKELELKVKEEELKKLTSTVSELETKLARLEKTSNDYQKLTKELEEELAKKNQEEENKKAINQEVKDAKAKKEIAVNEAKKASNAIKETKSKKLDQVVDLGSLNDKVEVITSPEELEGKIKEEE